MLLGQILIAANGQILNKQSGHTDYVLVLACVNQPAGYIWT